MFHHIKESEHSISFGKVWKNFNQGVDVPTILIMALMPPSMTGFWSVGNGQPIMGFKESTSS